MSKRGQSKIDTSEVTFVDLGYVKKSPKTRIVFEIWKHFMEKGMEIHGI